MCRKGKNDLSVTFGRVIVINILILGLGRTTLLSNALYCHYIMNLGIIFLPKLLKLIELMHSNIITRKK